VNAKTLIAIGMIVGLIATPASAEEPAVDLQGLLSVAKVAGSCGILSELIDLQQKTRMDGGDEFVSRFVSTEAARRGLSAESMFAECGQAVGAYDKLWAVSDQIE
jgi:hypothetical protein